MISEKKRGEKAFYWCVCVLGLLLPLLLDIIQFLTGWEGEKASFTRAQPPHADTNQSEATFYEPVGGG